MIAIKNVPISLKMIISIMGFKNEPVHVIASVYRDKIIMGLMHWGFDDD